MELRKVSLGARPASHGDEIELAIAEAGSSSDKRLLLLHGFTGAKEDFTEYLDRLGAEGWHAVAPDHRGHGESSKPPQESDYSISILADDAVALVDSLGWERFAVLGHSMGGYVAQRIAMGAPQRLTALVLMDTGHDRVADLDPNLVEAAVSIVRTNGIDALADILAGRESPLDTPAHRRLMRERPGYVEFEDYKFRSSAAPLYVSLGRELVETTEDTIEDLAKLPRDLPVLVIVGEQDKPFVGPSRRMADTIPGASLAVIPDAGHSPQFESPDAWWTALGGFLSGVPGARR